MTESVNEPGRADGCETGMLQRTRRAVAELLADECGLTTMEYALLLALLAVGAILAYFNFGRATSDLAMDSTQRLPGSEHGPTPAQ